MAITFELPEHIEKNLREEFGDLNQAAKEAFLVQSYRESRLSVGDIAQILDIGVLETEQWLGERGVPLNYTVDDFHDDCASLAKDFPPQ